jgi:Zn-dependent protease
MGNSEFSHILAAIIILTIISGFTFVLQQQWQTLTIIFAFCVIIISVSILSKKITAHLLDADVEHEIWLMKNFGFKKSLQSKKPIPAGLIIPIILSLFSLGIIKFMAVLTYETRALKHRAAKRFGAYSYTEMTDWHNAIIGASGIIFILLLSLMTYLLPFQNIEILSKLAAFYAFVNILPISKLDGTQIFFGSRILWAVLFSISTIFTLLAITTI